MNALISLFRKYFWLLLIVGLFVVLIFSSDNLSSNDDVYRHIKTAYLYGHSSYDSIEAYPWLPYSFRYGPANIWFLFHFILIPFTFFGNLILGAKLATIFFFCFIVFWLLYFLKYLGVSYKAFWVLVFFLSSSDFLFRLTLLRSSVLVILLTLLFLHSVLLENKKRVFIFSLLFSLANVAAPIFIFLAFIFDLVSYFFTQRKSFFITLASFFGVLIGLIIHPDFPSNILMQYQQTIGTLIIARLNGVVVGADTLPYGVYDFAISNFLLIILFLTSFVAYIHKIKAGFLDVDRSKKTYLLVISILFVVLSLFGRRFIEYWLPVTVLFSALVLSEYFENINWGKIKVAFLKYWQFKFISVVLVFFVFWFVYLNVFTVVGYLNFAPRADLYKAGVEWVSAHSKQGEIVFNTQWDQFPQLFYWNDYNYYVVGMDPTFMYVYDKELYFKWRVVSDDEMAKWGSVRDLYRTMFVDFSSRFVFVEKNRNPRLVEFLDFDVEGRYFERGFEDEGVVVYKLKNK